MALSSAARKAQADCLRRFLPVAEGFTPEATEEAALAVERGDVEYDAEYLESLAR